MVNHIDFDSVGLLSHLFFILHLYAAFKHQKTLWFQTWENLNSGDKCFNPLSANPTKWLKTLKQFVRKLPTNCLSVFDHFVGLALIGLKRKKHFNCKITCVILSYFRNSYHGTGPTALSILSHSNWKYQLPTTFGTHPVCCCCTSDK